MVDIAQAKMLQTTLYHGDFNNGIHQEIRTEKFDTIIAIYSLHHLDNGRDVENLYRYFDWLQTQKESTDIYENKRYAVILKQSSELIGMVGVGLEDTVNEVEVAYFMAELYQRKGFKEEALNAVVNWCFEVSDILYLVAIIDCANIASCRLAEQCGFELFEKRTPIGHIQPNIESDSYYYYRKYRK